MEDDNTLKTLQFTGDPEISFQQLLVKISKLMSLCTEKLRSIIIPNPQDPDMSLDYREVFKNELQQFTFYRNILKMLDEIILSYRCASKNSDVQKLGIFCQTIVVLINQPHLQYENPIYKETLNQGSIEFLLYMYDKNKIRNAKKARWNANGDPKIYS